VSCGSSTRLITVSRDAPKLRARFSKTRIDTPQSRSGEHVKNGYIV
jgi:hypothetical protein